MINSSQLKAMLIAGSNWLEAHITHVNNLNVFPIPDGDTGTNMSLTLKAALKDVQQYHGSHAGDLATLVSHGALMGARGNSGVILSQILEGFSESIRDKETFSILEFAQALQQASNKAYKTVINPVEGTILTVINEVARVSQQIAKKTSHIETFLTELLITAKNTLNLTPELLPVLKEAGVVDSGGQGFVYFLEGMLRHVKGLPVKVGLNNYKPKVINNNMPLITNKFNPEYGYDVQFLIKGDNLAINQIRKKIAKMGDCPLVVGTKKTLKVHVHVSDPGLPLSYGVTQGTLADIVVENMTLQNQSFVASSTIIPPPNSIQGAGSLEVPSLGGFRGASLKAKVSPLEELREAVDTAIICVAPSTGFNMMFKSLGATHIINGGQSYNPSTQVFVQAINQLKAEQIIILPNNSNIILSAEQACSLVDKKVHVIPTKTVPQGINALLAFNNEDDLANNKQTMFKASQQVKTIEITKAVRNTTLNKIKINKGDVIGLLDNKLIATGQDPNQVSLDILAQMEIETLEIITIYYGQNISLKRSTMLTKAINKIYPHLQSECINGEQPHYNYIISLE